MGLAWLLSVCEGQAVGHLHPPYIHPPTLTSTPTLSLCSSCPQVEKAEQDKQSAIIRAQGEAASATLIGQAVQQNPAFLTLRKIEAAREIASTVSASANRIFLSSDSLLLNLSDYESMPGKKK